MSKYRSFVVCSIKNLTRAPKFLSVELDSGTWIKEVPSAPVAAGNSLMFIVAADEYVDGGALIHEEGTPVPIFLKFSTKGGKPIFHTGDDDAIPGVMVQSVEIEPPFERHLINGRITLVNN